MGGGFRHEAIYGDNFMGLVQTEVNSNTFWSCIASKQGSTTLVCSVYNCFWHCLTCPECING